VNVLVTGIPFFALKTARLLAAHANGSDRFRALDTSTRGGQARFLAALPAADAVFCHWGTLARARTLELALALHKRVVQYWLGTDVLFAADAARSGSALARYAGGCAHVCESSWTRDELAAIGVHAKVLPVAPMGSIAPEDEATREPGAFTVLGYVGRGREDFYRLDAFRHLARDFPELTFRIAGTDGAGRPAPSNVELLGWADDVSDLYRDCAVFVRIPEHDGYSSSVREALAWGRHVIASYPYRYCRHVTDYASLRAELHTLQRRFEAGRLRSNERGRNFVLREFDDDKVASGLRRLLAGAP
jgi:hypothetical protein